MNWPPGQGNKPCVKFSLLYLGYEMPSPLSKVRDAIYLARDGTPPFSGYADLERWNKALSRLQQL